MEEPFHVFCCYARPDQSYLLELKKRLIPLQREGLILVHADSNELSQNSPWDYRIYI